jgi:hypothetical protein
MPNEMVWEIIDSYVNAAGRLVEAELDGVEILAGMGYLVAQFLNPATNHRQDEFGGSVENRMRLLREIVSRTRNRIGPGKTLGIRITLDEKIESGLSPAEVIQICQSLEHDGDLDYFSVISGSTAAPGGWVHVFPPMAVPHAFVADDAATLKASVNKPVLVAGRINQPQVAEEIIAHGKADMVGLVRALIADPEFVNKFSSGRAEDIRACIGCNQACVGHRLAHHVISCIQNPLSGREARYGTAQKTGRVKRILVIGGGPGGMKAAVTAAGRGHEVHLVEKAGSLGGQVKLAEKLPGRAEFGGVTTNLVRELEMAGVEVKLNTGASKDIIRDSHYDSVIVATGSSSRLPDIDTDEIPLVDARAVISGDAALGQRVVIADWACDWSGLGLAQKLALEGHHVRLMCGAPVAGDSLQGIVRDQWIGEVHKLGVEITAFARLYGGSGRTAFFQHMINNEAVVCEDVDTIVSCYAARANGVPGWLSETNSKIYAVGDAISPRTVEEAVLEGFEVAWDI